jgi:hypothetical protein
MLMTAVHRWERFGVTIDVYKEWLGIPEGTRPPDHYTLLRLAKFDDDTDRVRKNYKKLNGHVRKYATGQYMEQSQKLLNELAKAMLCLTDLERKQEYDRGFGRIIDDRDKETGRRPLTAYLMDDGLITSAQVDEAKQFSERAGLSLRDAIVQKKMVDADIAARYYARELQRPYIDLAETVPDDEILEQLPKPIARRHVCLPLFVDDDRVLVACSDEPSTELEDEIRLRYGAPLRAVIATPLAINQAIAKHYTELAARQADQPARPVKKAASAAAAASASPAAAPKKAKSKLNMTPAEKTQRRNLGLFIACWIVIGLTNLDSWVLQPMVWKRLGFIPDWFPFVASLIICPPALFILYNTHIKE